jgi:tRNA 2-selenouridine synthase
MPEYITANTLYKLMESFPLIDVRSPAEFLNGHIPGAYNIPLFTNEERALIGTRYKKSGKDFAIELGLEIVGPKMIEYVRQAKKIAIEKTLIMHCWRGGMRSASMAWLFETIGLKVYLLEGGYKNYRHFNRAILGDAKKIIILSGYTGSGKTDILKALQQKGEQIIDLEGLAHHKGSAFGAIGQEPQPSNEQFENNLTFEWSKLDLNKRIWIEDESITMGKNGIPDTLFNTMRKAPVIRIEIPQPVRAQRLVNEYACFGSAMLEKAIHRIATRLGPQNTKASLDALATNDFSEVARLTLSYYDKAYLKGLSKREPESIKHLAVSDDNPDSTAEILIEMAAKL